MTRPKGFLPSSTAERAALVALAAFAFGFSIYCGRRGFFAFDASIVFDGGVRVLAGQVPYRDFLIPFGPVSFALQAVWFALFGVSWVSYLAHAAAINALASLVTWRILKDAAPDDRLGSSIALLGGLVAAAWFYPPFGLPFFDQTALFLHLCALAALPRGPRHATGAGVLVALACLTKQNAGMFSLLTVAWLAYRFRVLGRFLLGCAAAALLFLGWLLVFSDVGTFIRNVFEMPLSEASNRLGRTHAFAGAETTAAGSIEVVLLILAGAAAAYARSRASSPGSEVPGPWEIATTLVVARLGFSAITNNSMLALFGLLGASVGLSACTLRKTGGSIGRASLVPGLVAMMTLVALGVRSGLDRGVHEFWWDARFDRVSVSQALWPATWSGGEAGRAPRVRDVDAVADYLRSHGQEFFSFPDTTIFYGLAGRPSRQPLVWFHKGVTYPRDPDPELDRRIVQSLEDQRIEFVIIEDVTFLGTDKRLRDFPYLQAFLRDNFEEERAFGTFRILTRAAKRARSAEIVQGAGNEP